VDLTHWPPEPGNQYPVPPLSYEDEGVVAKSIVVLPGRPESVAISLDCPGCGPDELVVLDSGTPRPNRATRDSASVIVVGPPGYLFALDTADSGNQLSTIALDDAGATQTTFQELIRGGWRIAYADDFVVATSGHVVDVSTPESAVRAGTFAYEGEVITRAGRSEVVMLSYAHPSTFVDTTTDVNELAFRRLNLTTFRADFEKPLAGLYAALHDFVEVKPGLFAFVDLWGQDFNSLNPLRANVVLFTAANVDD
jgi:hypothetical protein